jgi:hypothetical protein
MAVLTFASCGEKTFTVTFDTKGGSAVAPIVDLVSGSTISEPVTTMTGGIFEGWFKEPTYNTEWNFDTDVVTSDITLYAKWDTESDRVGQYVTWYWGTSSLNTHNFQMILYDENVFDKGAYKEPGFVYIFNMYAESADPALEKGYIVPLGTYKFDEYNSFIKLTFSKQNSALKRASASNTAESNWESIAAFTDGNITITKRVNGNYVVKAVVKYTKDSETKTLHLRYEGDLISHSSEYKNEPLEAKTFTKSYTLHFSTNYHDVYQMGADYVDFTAQNTNNDQIRHGFLLEPNSSTLPAGTLNIIEVTQEFSEVPYVKASEGKKTNSATSARTLPSILQQVQDTYFIKSGTVKIEPNAVENTSKIIIEAKSYFGSTINVTYTGVLTTQANL